MENVKLNVTGMSCAHCEKAVVMALEDIGAASVKASATEAFVEVAFDPAKLTLEAIKAEIADVGYTVE